jgi:hypothetical protein
MSDETRQSKFRRLAVLYIQLRTAHIPISQITPSSNLQRVKLGDTTLSLLNGSLVATDRVKGLFWSDDYPNLCRGESVAWENCFAMLRSALVLEQLADV